MKIAEDGERRFKSKIPPGYMDAVGKDSKNGFQRFGDLIIWHQIIELAKSEKKSVVIITNDINKEDWCYKDTKNKGRIERPREELIKEMKDKANVKLWMYSLSQFLHKSEKLLDIQLKESSIEEVNNLNNIIERNEDLDEEYQQYIRETIGHICKRNDSIIMLFEELDTNSITKIWKKEVELTLLEIRNDLKYLKSLKNHFITYNLNSLGRSVLEVMRIIVSDEYTKLDQKYHEILNDNSRIDKKSFEIIELFEHYYQQYYLNFL